MSQIPRFNQIKTKPFIGEIRLTNNGLRRRIYDGHYWQNLCMGDPNCRLQAKVTCRNHKLAPSDPTHSNEQNQSPSGQSQTSVNDLSTVHQIPRASLPNTSKSFATHSSSRRSSLTTKTRSRTIITQHTEEKQSLPNSLAVESPSLENVFDPSLEKREVKTRNGRRVRCNGFVWKHLCAHRKTGGPKRKAQRQTTLPTTIRSEEMTLLPAATIDAPKPTMTTRKRKTAGDVNSEEFLVPKRRTAGKRRADSNKSITLQLEQSLCGASIIDTLDNEKSIGLVDVHLPLSIKPTRLYTRYPSTEIPLQTSVACLPYESSPSAILEEFGTIIKKEAVEESCLAFPTIYSEAIELHCETLQDFLRLEELKEKDFQLDCQRIAYRLAKIQDCLSGSSSTVC